MTSFIVSGKLASIACPRRHIWHIDRGASGRLDAGSQCSGSCCPAPAPATSGVVEGWLSARRRELDAGRSLPPRPGAGATASPPAAMPKPCRAPSVLRFCPCARARGLSASPFGNARTTARCSRRHERRRLLDALLDQMCFGNRVASTLGGTGRRGAGAGRGRQIARGDADLAVPHDLRTPLASIALAP